MRVRYSYLPQQFQRPDEIIDRIRQVVAQGDYTLGAPVLAFEQHFAERLGASHAVAVASGTDALALALKAVGIRPGDDVITAANTFVATVAAIQQIGAHPVLVDVTDNYVMDTALLEGAMTQRTTAIVPVHLAGEPVDMGAVCAFAEKYGLVVVEDACQAVGAAINDRKVGTFGDAAAFSFHPLKNLNVWGEAGMVVTSSTDIAERVRRLRNYGLKNRDEFDELGWNSRCDSIQAIVGDWLLPKLYVINAGRRLNANLYDRAFRGIAQIQLPPARDGYKRVHHLYMMQAEQRDTLVAHLQVKEIEAKVHYPIPLHLQKGVAHLGYKVGDFPVSERQAARVVSLPVDQHLSQGQIDYVIEQVHLFYTKAIREWAYAETEKSYPGHKSLSAGSVSV